MLACLAAELFDVLVAGFGAGSPPIDPLFQLRLSAELIRRLIEKIVLTPNEGGTALAIDLHGDLAGVLRVAARGKGNGLQQRIWRGQLG